ncbi:hypothetical protein M8C17_21395 [Micromonospora sp. RHAY321]|uniref:hypothetical protein n=1 Tax=Micromonospora sp. RHAY321 TaxID=2944807 RepID=UPI00207D12C7|nr:hypothetical protein [Micromonospora sp. RHAY321]MCO1597709.1 hypothetical protein [Micromonospora sp. RHAY321]
MVQVGPHGAFSVNSMGLDRAPFPLSFSVHEAMGCGIVYAAAAQAAELADVLMSTANGTFIVVGLETNSFLDDEYLPWRPSRIAAEQGVDCEVHSLDVLTSGVIGLSEEALVIRRDDLPRFLAGWSPYELTLIDVPGTPTAERVDEIVLALGTALHGEPVLPALAGSRLWFSGHDDCYVAVESTDPVMPAAVLSRLLALLAGSALFDASAVDVTDPDVETMESLIEESPHWIGVLGTRSDGSIAVDLSATSEPWRLGQSAPEQVDRTAIYDIAYGAWRLTGPLHR